MKTNIIDMERCKDGVFRIKKSSESSRKEENSLEKEEDTLEKRVNDIFNKNKIYDIYSPKKNKLYCDTDI